MSNEITRALQRLTELRRQAYQRRSAFDRMREDEGVLDQEVVIATADLSRVSRRELAVAADGSALLNGKPAPEHDHLARRVHLARARLRGFREERQAYGETAARFTEAAAACEQHLRRRGVKVEPGRPW